MYIISPAAALLMEKVCTRQVMISTKELKKITLSLHVNAKSIDSNNSMEVAVAYGERPLQEVFSKEE